jgi:hypothetical protein
MPPNCSGLGNTADFTIIGARRDPRDEQKLSNRKLPWTPFSIECLENKDEVCRFDSQLRFRIFDIGDRHDISKENILYLNRHNYFERELFVKSIPEFGVGFDHGQQLQPA